METYEIIILIIAAWGALLSTVLGVREFFKERRRLRVRIDFVDLFVLPWVTISNIGHRPITIVSIELWFYQKNGRRYLPERSTSLKLSKNQDFDNLESSIILPIVLGDGGAIGFTFESGYSDAVFAHYVLKRSRTNVLGKIFVVDAEGKYYSARKGKVFNPRSQASPIQWIDIKKRRCSVAKIK